MNLNKIIFLLLLLNFSYFVNASLFINNFNYNFDNNIFNYNLTIANSENSVQSNIKFKFSLVNKNSNAIMLEKSFYDSYYNYEAKIYSNNFDFSNIPSGEYILNFVMYEKSGAPINGFKKNINFTNFNKELNSNLKLILNSIENGPYLLNLDSNDNKIEESHGMLGKNLNGSKNIFIAINFNQKINEDIKKNLKLNVELYPSYSQGDESVYEVKNKLNFEEINSSIGLLKLNYSKSGTYNVKVNFYYKENFLYSKIIRMVISGKSGGIMNILNEKDVYNKGDTFKLTGILIGPADGATKLENPNLKLKIIQDKKIIEEEIQNIENLGFQPVNFQFLIPSLKEDLTNYKVILELYDNKELLDSVKLNYSKLTPKYLYKNGLVYINNPNMCLDDGICSDNEKNLGNCLDCNLDKIKPFEDKVNKVEKINNFKFNEDSLNNDSNYLFLINIILVLLIMIGIGVYIYRRKKENE